MGRAPGVGNALGPAEVVIALAVLMGPVCELVLRATVSLPLLDVVCSSSSSSSSGAGAGAAGGGGGGGGGEALDCGRVGWRTRGWCPAPGSWRARLGAASLVRDRKASRHAQERHDRPGGRALVTVAFAPAEPRAYAMHFPFRVAETARSRA